MPATRRDALALAALATCATALLSVPILAAALSTTVTVAAIAALAVVVGTVVLLVTRTLDRGPNWFVRLYRVAVVATFGSFLLNATLSPPDPLTKLVYGASGLGVSLLLAHVAVAYDVDRRVLARVR
jgi:uncharacterized membrane protein YhaH (DUF805 family)